MNYRYAYSENSYSNWANASVNAFTAWKVSITSSYSGIVIASELSSMVKESHLMLIGEETLWIQASFSNQ